ncbi:HAD family hydrolase [Thermophilibacter provencensis]|uniref:HAD family hydrolase n=1 Tax=Thermophilibacter provencensis TaxID=1852386 RepID=A0ABT7V232_9ACTN|nr:HAD family hydrolase [Thermophilibacter provencensis]MDM8270638.1 HAD family hydrolase [Thermophilibacter provencensis]
MIRAVLFDMDDTLLRLNLTAFIARYVAGASSILARAARTTTMSLGAAYVRGFLAMDDQDRTDSLTNEQVFNQVIYDQTGIPLDDPVIHDLMDYYESEIVPGFSGGLVAARPVEGAREAIGAVHDAGLICALATNPTFSLACDRARMGWAGVSEDDFALVSTFSNSTRSKPSAQYYQEFANALGVRLEECLMVGNDATRDFARPECGLRTAYVGHARPKKAVWHGSMEKLSHVLPDLLARLNEESA